MKMRPILDSLDIPAVFFVNALPYAENKVSLVHKIHYIRANLSPQVLFDKISAEYSKRSGKKYELASLVDKDIAKNSYRYDKDVDAQLKFVLNTAWNSDLLKPIVEEIFLELVSDEAEFCSKWYLGPEQIVELAERQYFGFHSYSHNPLSKMSTDAVKKDMKTCFKTFEKLVKKTIQGMSYPYGYTEAVSLDVARACSEVGIKFAFTMERAFNRTLQSPLLFARADTNDVPGGKTLCSQSRMIPR
ncbi:MAG: polysaccharide deacetylase family protein [Candidatus Hadarchaeota archaeon]